MGDFMAARSMMRGYECDPVQGVFYIGSTPTPHDREAVLNIMPGVTPNLPPAKAHDKTPSDVPSRETRE